MDNIAQIIIAQKIDWKKIGQDITILRTLKDYCLKNGWRMVVSGGYGLDLFLNITTRSHRDIDVIVYGQSDRANAGESLTDFFKGIFSDAKIEIKSLTHYLECDTNADGFGANIYYVQTLNDPFTDLKRIIDASGNTLENSQDQFPKPTIGHLGKFEVEIQDQNAHLADILSKLSPDSADKYSQDIDNLKHITDPTKVELLKQKN